MRNRGDGGFEAFVELVRPRLRRAFLGWTGPSGVDDAVAEALGYAWEHWDQVQLMENPAGYLYRVGQSRTRTKAAAALPAPEVVGVPDIEPGLIPALAALPLTQRTAVWLVHACQWRYSEVAEAMGTTVSMVGNHVSRGLERLRKDLEVDARA